MIHQEVIQPYLDLIKSSEDSLDEKLYAEAIEKIEPLVAKLLKGNINDLLNLLYRLDISEEKVKQILFGTHKKQASTLLSEAIVQREIVKRIFRLKYQSK